MGITGSMPDALIIAQKQSPQMGDRANYIVVQDDSVVFKYSQFGALSVASWMARGPKAVMEMIRNQPSKPGLMDDIFCQGMIFVDVKNNVALFSGDDAPETTAARRIFLNELRHKWPGWCV